MSHRTAARLGATITCLLVVAVSAEGCRQVAGIDDAPAMRDSRFACGVPFASATCSHCVATSCCAEAGQCAGATGCGDLAECLAACAVSDLACTSGCRARLPSGYGVEAAALHSCESAKCGSECGISCGGYVYPDSACAACGVAQCCEVATACMRDPECATLAACERQCDAGDDACLWLCERARPAGVSKQRAFGDCLESSCKKSCVSRKWACLGPSRMPPPPGTSPAITITYGFVDYETYVPISGLTVRVCNAQDFACTRPLAEPVFTDANGQAVVRLRQASFDGYAEISGEKYGPVLFYLPPLTRDFVDAAKPIPTKATLDALFAAIVPPAAGRANLLVGVLDCAGAPTSGATLSIEPAAGSTPFYFSGRLPSATATMTGDDGYGAGGFLNVEANKQITVRAAVVENGRTFAPVDVRARPGTSTFTLVVLYAAAP